LDGNYGNLPSAFEPNTGQTAPEVRFLTRGRGMTTFFTDTEAVMVLHKSEQRPHDGFDRPEPPPKVEQAVVRMKLAGAMKPRQATGLEKLPGVSNYFIGNDPKKWRTDVPHYARIEYQGVYPGIDLVWYGNQRQLEYDFVVAAGADPKQIQVAYEGVESVGVEAGGELVLRTALGEVRQQQPRVYQEIGGKRVEVGARYAMVARNRVSFQLAKYDRKRELRIDPVVLAYSTYLGGGSAEKGFGIAVDAAGSTYVTGYTYSTNFPTQSAYQATLQGTYNAFVTKLTPAGNALVYSTYLGGSNVDEGHGIAVDGAGSAYVTGYTGSDNFPTQSPYQATHQGGLDAFVTKLTPAGNALVYSTYLGGRGDDYGGQGIAVDGAGSAYVTGYTNSTNFPTQSAYQATFQGGPFDAFVTKLTPAGNALVYSTYLGGSGDDAGWGIAVDGAGSAYVTGETYSPNFPTQSAYQATFQGGTYDAFVTKLTPAGNALVYSTYLGGSSYDYGYGIAVDGAGSAYVTGYTNSTNFPTRSSYQTYQGGDDAFVTKLAPAGNALVYSTCLGGSGSDHGQGIAVDAAGSAYVTGWNWSANFPTQSAFQATLQGLQDAFVTKLTPTGNALVYSTYLGGSDTDGGYGIAVDGAGSAYITGYTSSTNFPTQSPYQATNHGGYDAFVTKLQLPATVAINAVLDSSSGQATIAPNSFVTIYGSNFTSWTGDWSNYAPNGMLPTMLGGVQVLIDGKNCFVSYASGSQLNVVTPPDTASGSVSVEVITAQGTVTSTATMAQVAPALFGYTLSSGRFYAVAQIANTTTIVAPVGTFGSAPSRPAQAGDYVVLYAIGMGSTNPAAPAGVVLPTAYPVADLSSVTVKFGSVPATVSWAGLVYAGEFQVNVQVPLGLSGDQPVVMTVGGQSTQANAYLTFQ
jgi:uncharacterized protein (TIGR03437 family)